MPVYSLSRSDRPTKAEAAELEVIGAAVDKYLAHVGHPSAKAKRSGANMEQKGYLAAAIGPAAWKGRISKRKVMTAIWYMSDSDGVEYPWDDAAIAAFMRGVKQRLALHKTITGGAARRGH